MSIERGDRQRMLMVLWESVMECLVQIIIQSIYVANRVCSQSEAEEDGEGASVSSVSSTVIFSIAVSTLLMILDIVTVAKAFKSNTITF